MPSHAAKHRAAGSRWCFHLAPDAAAAPALVLTTTTQIQQHNNHDCMLPFPGMSQVGRGVIVDTVTIEGFDSLVLGDGATLAQGCRLIGISVAPAGHVDKDMCMVVGGVEVRWWLVMQGRTGGYARGTPHCRAGCRKEHSICI